MPGSVVARKSIRQDWGAARRDMPLRTLRLYRTQLIVFALVGMENLAFPSVLHALALVWLGPRVVPRQADGMGVAICRWLAAAGRFSLQVFSLALFLSWGVTAAFRLWPGAVRGLGPLLLAGCAILLAFGRWLEHRRQDAPALGPAPAGLPWMEAAE